MSTLLPLEDPDGHRWVRPTSAPCPNCVCCREFVCVQQRWSEFTAWETYPTRPCPCEMAHLKELSES